MINVRSVAASGFANILVPKSVAPPPSSKAQLNEHLAHGMPILGALDAQSSRRDALDLRPVPFAASCIAGLSF